MYRNRSLRIFLILMIISAVNMFIGCKGNDVGSKINTTFDIEKTSTEELIKKVESNGKYWQGISVFIVWDYSKHEKYQEWETQYTKFYNIEDAEELENQIKSSKYMRVEYLYDAWFNDCCYELVKNQFSNGEYKRLRVNRLYFIYSSVEDLRKDYDNLVEFAKKDFVDKVVIKELEGI